HSSFLKAAAATRRTHGKRGLPASPPRPRVFKAAANPPNPEDPRLPGGLRPSFLAPEKGPRCPPRCLAPASGEQNAALLGGRGCPADPCHSIQAGQTAAIIGGR